MSGVAGKIVSVLDDEPAPPAPPIVRRRRRWLRRALLALAASALGLLLVVHLPPVQDRLAATAVRGLAARQNLDLEWRELRFNLITRTAYVADLRLGERGASAPLLTAERVSVRFPFGLFRGRLDGLDVTLVNGVVTLEREGGRWSTVPAAWTRSRPGGRPRSLPKFAALRLHDIAVVYADKDTNFRTDTRGLRVDLLPTGREPGDLAGPLVAGAITRVDWEPRSTTLTLRGGRAYFSPGATGVDQLHLDAPEGQIRSDVRFAFKGTDRFALTARADLQADQLAGWVQALDSAKGNLQVDISMPAQGGAPAFADIVVHAQRLSWRGVEFTALRATGPLETGAVTLNHVEFLVGAGRIEGDARLVWRASGDNRASLRGRDVDVAAIVRTLVPDIPAVSRFMPAAVASGTFRGAWPSWDANRLEGLLQSTWRQRVPAGPERYAIGGSMDVSFRRGPWLVDMDTRIDDALALTGRWTLGSSAADFGRWPMSGRLQLDGATPGTLLTGMRLFDLDPPVDDLDQAHGDLTGTVALSGTLGEPVAEIEAVGLLGWPDQPVIESRALARITADQVQLTSFDAESGPSRATASLVIDLDRDDIAGQFQAWGVPAESWLRRFDLEAPATGIVDATGTLSGPLSRIVVDADVSGGPLVLAGQPFARVSAHVRYDGLAIAATDIVLGRGEGTITGALAWTREDSRLDGAFDMKAMAFETRLPGVVDADGAEAGVLRAVAGGHGTIGGTVERPTVDVALSTPEVTLDSRRFGPLELTARTETASIARVSLAAAELGATVGGTVDLALPRAFDLTARVDTADSPLALDTRGIAVELGAMSLEARVTGRLSEPQLDTADLRIDRLDGAIVDIDASGAGATTVAVQDRREPAEAPAPLLPFAMQPGARIRLQASGVPPGPDGPPPRLFTVDDAVLTTGRTRVTASGIFGSADDTLSVTGDGRLEDFAALIAALAPAGFEQAVAEGPVRVQAVLAGTADRPVVKGTAALDGARIGDGIRPPFESVWVRAALDGEQVRLDLVEGRWQGAHLALSGMVPTWFLRLPGSSRTSQRATLSGHVDDVTLRVLEPFVEADALRATTFESGVTFELSATEPALDAVTAELIVERAVLRSRELGIAQRAPARLRLERGVITLAPWTLGAPWSTRTVFTLAGSATLPVEGRPASIDLGLDGAIDLRAVGLLFGGYRPAGTARVNARVTGPAGAPSVDGVVAIADGELLIRDPRLVLSEANGEVRFSGDRLSVSGLTAAINGGLLEVGGSMRQPGRGAPDGALTIRTRGMLLEVPRGLRSAIDTDLTFAERPDGRFALEGTVSVADAAYRETLLVTGGIMTLLSPRDDAIVLDDIDGPRVTWLVMDLRVRADDTIAIDTAYGKFSVGANLRVQGTPARPRLSGTVAIAPGGELYVGGRTYQVESGVVEFRGQAMLRPDIRFNARTNVGGYDITLDVQTRGDVTETSLQSDPPLPEDDIASLLLSGQRGGGGDPVEAVTEQLAAALSGELVGAVGRAIGFDSVRVEQGNPGDIMFDPTLASGATNPVQRLTFSKRVFPDLEVVVSQSLRESGDITWIVSWQPLRALELRFVQLDDEDRSYEVRNDLSFGGGVRRARRGRTRREVVETVSVATSGPVTEAEVRSLLRLTEGDRFDFYDWQGDRDRLQRWLLDRGHYEGRLTARRDPATPPPPGSEATTPVHLQYRIETGPRTELRVEGVSIPGELRQALVDAWVDVPVDALLLEEFSALLRPWLASRRHLQPDIAVDIATRGDVKVATLTVDPGPVSTDRVIVFSGNEALGAAQLDAAIDQAGVRDRVWTSPADARAVVLSTYRRNGYLSAEVSVGEPRFEGPRAELPVRIEEGPRFRAGTVRVDGVGEVAGVNTAPPIAEGAVLSDRMVAEAVRELQRNFRRAGYRGTRVTAESATRDDGGTVDLVFNVLLGQRARLQQIRIAGADATSHELIERTMDLDPGEPLDNEVLSRARDRLYDTGLFRTVTLDTEAVERPDGTRDQGALAANVTVEELPRYRLRYGFQLYDPSSPLFDPHWGTVDPGVVADLTRRGLFGRGLTGGIGTRMNPSEQTVRAYLSSRTFLGLPLQTNIIGANEDQRTASGGFALDSRINSITFDQRVRYRRLFQLGYGYSFENHKVDFLVNLPTVPAPVPVELAFNIGRLLATLVIDERDNVVDTRQGPFHSSSIEYGPAALGSTRAFRKYLGQQFYFVPWKRVTFGAAVRFEAAGGPGRGLLTTERLRVGGGSTVRGFEDDTLSLRDITGETPGTTNIMVLNQETRFPLTRRLQGALFWDHARIYGETGDFTGLRRRHSVGAGVRLLLPFIILRVDYGYPLTQDERNDKGRWHFAIGQAF